MRCDYCGCWVVEVATCSQCGAPLARDEYVPVYTDSRGKVREDGDGLACPHCGLRAMSVEALWQHREMAHNEHEHDVRLDRSAGARNRRSLGGEVWEPRNAYANPQSVLADYLRSLQTQSPFERYVRQCFGWSEMSPSERGPSVERWCR